MRANKVILNPCGLMGADSALKRPIWRDQTPIQMQDLATKGG